MNEFNESRLEDLAFQLTMFMKNYDTYEYRDSLQPGQTDEDMINQTKASLTDLEAINYYIEFYENLVEEDADMEPNDRAQCDEIIKRLKDTREMLNAVKTGEFAPENPYNSYHYTVDYKFNNEEKSFDFAISSAEQPSSDWLVSNIKNHFSTIYTSRTEMMQAYNSISNIHKSVTKDDEWVDTDDLDGEDLERFLEVYSKMFDVEVIKAILVEMDYKGYYERFALTPEEFEKEFPETVAKGNWPITEADTDTLKPMVHIWFEPCVVGDDSWERHFTDMAWGLPESDIEAGNLAYIDHEQMQSLSQYLEDVSVYHCRAVFQHDNLPFSEKEIELQIMTAVPNPDYTVEKLECVEEGPVDGAPDFPDDYIFTFEFDIKLPRDSQTDIDAILNNVDGGELLSQHYERSAKSVSLDDRIKAAQEKASERTDAAKFTRDEKEGGVL